MGLINNHLNKENLKSNKDIYLLAKLSRVNDKGSMTFNEWQESGRFIDRKSFETYNPNENLHVDCSDVVMYLGGVYIQLLKSGEFFLDAHASGKSLDAIEIILWDKNSTLFWGQ
jgi:hypothetical protein